MNTKFNYKYRSSFVILKYKSDFELKTFRSVDNVSYKVGKLRSNLSLLTSMAVENFYG